MTNEDQILWDVVEEHLDEAEFLVELWQGARRSPQYTLAELADGPETRLLAHVDGVVESGPLALERVAWPGLDASEATRVAASALALLDGGEFRVLGVLDEPRAEGEETDDDEPVDEEAVRLAALRELAERLDALEPDEGQRTAVQEYELGAEAWRQSALRTVAEQLDADADEARAMELGEIGVLLEGHAPPDATAAVEDADEPLPPEWAALTPDERAQRREADLQDLEAQLAATTDEHERARLQGLQQVLKDEAAADAEEPAPPPTEAEPDAEPAPEPEPPDPRVQGLALALALSSHPQIGDHIRSRAGKAEGASLALLLQACADRGLHPGPALERGLAHDDPAVVCAALRAAAFGERNRMLAPVEARLQHRSIAVRSAALDTAMLWGSRPAWELALQSYKAPEAAHARLWLACLGDDRHAEALVPLLETEALRPDVLWALGFSGRVPAVEACLEWLDADDETTRRLAGEAVAAIVGLDLEDETLWEQDAPAPEPELEGDAPEQDQDDLDAELAATPEDELPLPIAAAIRERWATLETAFTPGQRYLLGKPVEREGPGWALPLLSCRRVDVVAREVVARSQGIGRWPGLAAAPRHQQAASALAELGRQAGAIQGDRR